MQPRVLLTSALLLGAFTALLPSWQSQQGAQQPPPGQQQQELQLTISGAPGALPHFAVPDFIALSPDAETAAAAKTIGQVLWDDLDFEREYDLVPRDTNASIPPARSTLDVPFDRWRELGVDGLVIGSVQKSGDALRVEVDEAAVLVQERPADLAR
jgi:hypothetical protein